MTVQHSAPLSLQARALTLGYATGPVIEGLDFDAMRGGITALVGPNGCGKSTLLRGLGRLLAPRGGSVLLDGESIHSRSTREVAQELGALPQSPSAPEGITVHDLVARGRHPHQRWFRQWSEEDEHIVQRALGWTGLSDLADRAVDELSGGQRQRAWISMVLAQETGVVLLDEPTNHLDIAHALEVLDLIDRLHDEEGRTVVVVLHDLNLAARYADSMVVMKEGRIVANGDPAVVLTEELLLDVFGLEARVLVDPVSERPWVVPIGQRHVVPSTPR